MYIKLETARLLLRPISPNDKCFILELVNSRGWKEFIGNKNILDEESAEIFIKRKLDCTNTFYNIFVLKETQTPIGIITFILRDNEQFPDIGFALLPEFENYGYTIEAAKAYLQEIKKINKYTNIKAITMPNNKRSIRIIQKLGFKYKFDSMKNSIKLSHFMLE